MVNLLNDCKIVLANTDVAAGVTTIDTAGLDTAGYDGICFVALLNSVVAGAEPTLAAQGATALAGGYGQIASQITPVVAAAVTDTILVLDTAFPGGSKGYRYVRAELVRGAQNCAVGGILAILYRGKKLPAAIDPTVLASLFGEGS